MAKEKYDELIFQLGDLAREHLAESKYAPRAMEGVFECEDIVLQVREEVTALEQQLNEEDTAFQDFLDQQEVEKAEQQEMIRKFRTAVAGVDARSREMKKKISSLKSAFAYQKRSLKMAEDKHKELEMREGHDVGKIVLSKEMLKKSRLHIMREQRHLEELEWDFNQILTPRPGQVGAQGILAHRRILEMEDELEARKAQHEQTMKDLDEAIAAKEEEVTLAEEDLDGALYHLGEEAYAARVPHPQLNPLYSKLDKSK